MFDEDLKLKAKIADVLECAVKEVIALVEADRDVEKNSAEPLTEWMTAAQLARYWQFVNACGEPITAGIIKWTKRAENEHPLPHACMGDPITIQARGCRSVGAGRGRVSQSGEESKETASRELKRRPDSSS